jgi:hypothetical protein
MLASYKDLLTFVATSLVFVSYIPYIRDLLKGKTKPHVYSWFLWGLVSSIIFVLQISDGAGAGSLVTLSAVLITFYILAVAITKNGLGGITKVDHLFLGMAVIAVLFWIFAKNPIVSITLLVLIELLGLVPTITKSWSMPYEETLFSWSLNGCRFILAIFALSKVTYITALYPISWASGNLLVALIIVLRRRRIAKER